jgi:hypothetical protein
MSVLSAHVAPASGVPGGGPGPLSHLQEVRSTRVDASGAAWRMRSLIAMGHNASRIARALEVAPHVVQRLIRGQGETVTVAFHLRASQLWDAWWDKTPPERTAAERRAAARARHQAMRCGWPAAAGLDEDLLDQPGYRPCCRYRPGAGTGTAPDFGSPPGRQRLAKENT